MKIPRLRQCITCSHQMQPTSKSYTGLWFIKSWHFDENHPKKAHGVAWIKMGGNDGKAFWWNKGYFVDERFFKSLKRYIFKTRPQVMRTKKAIGL